MGKQAVAVEPKIYSIEYEVTVRGELVVEAHSAAEAELIADSGGWEDDSFFDRAQIVNWERRSKAKPND